MSNSRLKADLILLSVAVIWGSGFTAQRVAASEMGVFLFNGLRFLVGAFVLLPFLAMSEDRRSSTRLDLARGWKQIFLLGSVLFAAAAFQQVGLRYTTTANAAFITGLYVVFIPLFLALFARQRLEKSIWLAAGLSAVGLGMLSLGSEVEGLGRINQGDALELAGAVFWALQVILLGRFVQQVGVLPISVGQYAVAGALSILAAILWEPAAWSAAVKVWWAILYLGAISTGLAFTLQAVGQRVAPPADAAILLNLEGVFAALFGWLLLQERLAAVQALGAALILTGALLAQSRNFYRRRTNGQAELSGTGSRPSGDGRGV